MLLLVRRVTGASMEPTLGHGRLIIAYKYRNLRPGHIVIFEHDSREKIKRIVKVDGDLVWVAGDNPSSSKDSRHFGPVNRQSVKARVLSRHGRGRAA